MLLLRSPMARRGAPVVQDRTAAEPAPSSGCGHKESRMGTTFETGSSGQTRSARPNGSPRTRGTALGSDKRPQANRVEPYQRLSDEDRGTGGESLANFLGFFSIGLGMAQVLAP